MNHPGLDCFAYGSNNNGMGSFTDENIYMDWFSGGGFGFGAANQPGALGFPTNFKRNERKSSTDVSMPDYIPYGDITQQQQAAAESQFSLATFRFEDDSYLRQFKVPTNTPTGGGAEACQREGAVGHWQAWPSKLC